jgi:methyltransferase family protein
VRISCPLCEGPSSFVFETRARSRRDSDGRFNYRRCELCSAIFLADRPEDPAQFPATQDDVSPIAARIARARLDQITPFAGGGRLVEVGSGTGPFADAARDAGFEVTGMNVEETSPAGTLDTLPPSRVIAMWQVLEKLADPWGCVEAASHNLEPGGVLAVEMPNPGSFQFRVTRGRWPHVDAPRHLFLIPAGLLDERARAAGLELVALTARDRAGRLWSRLGWQRLLMGERPGKARVALARAGGSGVATLMAPIERTDLRGTTYTAVFRK